MSRLSEARIAAGVLGITINGQLVPVGVWGTVHNLTPDESTPARNTTPFAEGCSVVSVCAIGGDAYFKQGDDAVDATTSDVYLPAGVWMDMLVPEGASWNYVSAIAAPGFGTIKVQLVERTP